MKQKEYPIIIISNPSLIYLFNFTGDGSICSTTSSTDNGDVDAFLLQVRQLFLLNRFILIIININIYTHF